MADDTDEEMFEIELDSIERTLCAPTAIYDIQFDCTRGDCIVNITVTIDAENVTTLEIVPMGMSELNRSFAALAEQTKAWRIVPG
ncbi:hypothetical protein [Methylobacterium sp. Leaf88]|uniref:hypothetical protein n=1 Tax=Methylobacterium sp. Leaf88 TaxID=1736244 RepID=UPI0006F8BF5F|nr:hypothetical protein [Methylobacterium sp. Leaf88]KQO76452.1 hypothetical protein ASF20_13990 [Methylobacterium sp. Leaf88]